jgi:hypothetical protein
VPAERSSSEPGRLFGEDEQGELERLGEADVAELNGGASGGEEVAVVERASLEPRLPVLSEGENGPTIRAHPTRGRNVTAQDRELIKSITAITAMIEENNETLEGSAGS